jgi:hypothetical protein
VQLFYIRMILGAGQNAGNHAALLRHAHAARGALGFDMVGLVSHYGSHRTDKFRSL